MIPNIFLYKKDMLTSWLKGKGAKNNCDNDEMGILWAYSKHARQ